jgi:trk system potassium uptake protein TrkA
MKKQIIVVGLGRFGESIASTLSSIGHEVLAVDPDETLVQQTASEVTHAVQVNPTNEAALRELGVGNFDIGIITIPVIETSVLSTILLKKLGVRYIIARAVNDLHEIILKKIGADKVVYPEREMGTGIAYVLTLGDVIDYIPVTAEYGVVKMSIQPSFIGKSLSELGFGHLGTWQVIVLLLQRKKEVLISPGGSETIKPGDVLVISGSWDKLEELFSQVQKTGGQ